MSDSGEATTTTTFFDTMPVEDFISLVEEFLDQQADGVDIDDHGFDEPVSYVPSFDEPSCEEPVTYVPSFEEPTSSDVDHTDCDETLDTPYSEYDGWSDAEFSCVPCDAGYAEWSSAYEYGHDYAESVWGDPNSW